MTAIKLYKTSYTSQLDQRKLRFFREAYFGIGGYVLKTNQVNVYGASKIHE